MLRNVHPVFVAACEARARARRDADGVERERA
jgi:hypothetical protein